MSLILIEGFSDSTIAKWDSGSGIGSVSSSSPRVPGGFYGSLGTLIKSFTAATNVISGFGLIPGYDTPRYIEFWGDSGVTQHITVARNTTTGLLEIRRGTTSGTLLATGTTVVSKSVWSYIEVSVTISDTVGEVHVRLNGSSTDEVSYTGDTKNGGTNDTIDKVRFRADSINASFSDIYILDSTGSTNNTFLGDVAVRILRPSGNGNSSQLTGSDADQTDNYLLVDDTAFSSTDYVGSATTTDKDTYTMSDLPTTATTVYGMQVNGMMHKSDAGAAQGRLVLRSGSTDYNSTMETLSTSAVVYSSDIYEQDPDTSSAWTVSGINGIETGMEVG